MLQNLKISTRLWTLLTALLAFLVVVGSFGLYNAHYLDQHMENMYSDNLIPIRELSLVKERVLHNRMAATNAVLHPEKGEKYIKELNENIALISRALETYMALDPSAAERPMRDKMMQANRRYVEEAINPAMEVIRRSDTAQLNRMLDDKIRPLYYDLKTALDELIELQIREAQHGKQEVDDMAERMKYIAIALILTAIIMGVLLGLSILGGIKCSLEEMRGVMSKMAVSGDLTPRAKISGNDEMTQIAQAFNQLIDSFAHIIRQVYSTSSAVSRASSQLSDASVQIEQGSQAQSQAAAATAASVEEISVSINSVAENTDSVRNLSDASLKQTRLGNQNVTELIGEVGKIEDAVKLIAGSVKEFVDSTRAIAGMTQQVKDIADQTNLLALNAAIEAARAGEQGRGFAVVADEVRKLAEKSAQSANEIDRVTNSLNQKSGDVEATVLQGLRSLQATSAHVERVSVVLTEAGASVEQSSQGIRDIAASVAEQGEASHEIARNVEKISQMSDENHAAMQSTTEQIAILDQLARDLQGEVGRFRV